MTALPSFVAAAVGAALVWVWFEHSLGLGLTLAAAVLLVGLLGAALYGIGKMRVKVDPISSERLMSAYLLVPICLSSLAGAGLIFLAVWLEPGEGASVAAKKTSAALLGAIGALIATLLVKGLEDLDGNYVAPRVQGAFQQAFKGRWSGDASDVVFEWAWKGYNGWEPSARRARAKAVAAAI
jgi:hypothetical protein